MRRFILCATAQSASYGVSRASFSSAPCQMKQLRYEAFAVANMKHKRLKPLV
jgi:hypothetical protein